MSIKSISSKEAKNAFGSFLDFAQREPVMITKRNRPVGVFFSVQDIIHLIQVSDTFKSKIHDGILA